MTIYKIFGINQSHAFGVPCNDNNYLAIHVRSGDVMRGAWTNDGQWIPTSVRSGHGQPRLSYYTNCISQVAAQKTMDSTTAGEEDFPQKNITRAIVLCEDFRNPVCLALRTFAHISILPLTILRTNLQNTLSILACAPRTCTAHGTLDGIWSNSIHNSFISKPQRYDIKFPLAPIFASEIGDSSPADPLKPNQIMFNASFFNGELFPIKSRSTDQWQNTCLQRFGMLL
uniref:Uncharacterized protein n=1 Tax=Aureoumbra lagunensis TaxID=44058 RepID=A0A7S3K4E9_9STRA|mmetsp:Transcript_5241/g.7384  ORF Transcript_5241/g.7384 Transcript_5241/m.7384 type:complete len:228 (+) Transcript_5241:76-759(+)